MPVTETTDIGEDGLDTGKGFHLGPHDRFFVVCDEKEDIVFLLDSSGSIDLNEWNLTLTFVNRIIDAFTIGPQDTQVASIATCVF